MKGKLNVNHPADPGPVKDREGVIRGVPVGYAMDGITYKKIKSENLHRM